MAVRIRLKKMGRTHRPFYRVCAMDKRTPRDGRVLEELGTYDTSVQDADARAVLKKDRIDYWLSVGAQPSENVAVLIKKYGTNGTHSAQQQAALQELAEPKQIPEPGTPASLPKKPEEAKPAEEAKVEEPKTEASKAEEAKAPAEATEQPAETVAPEAAAAEASEEQAGGKEETKAAE